MSKCARAIICVAAFSLFVAPAMAVERFPPPDFSDHKVPTMSVPLPRAELFQYLDLAALVVGLSLASYLAIVKRSRRGLFLLGIVSLVWLGFWRGGCICPIGAIGNVSLAVCDRTYVLPWTVAALFALPIVFTIFFGRTFCAAVCPLGAVQELVALKPVKIPTWLDHSLGLLAYVYLGAGVMFAATGTAFVICRYDPFVGLFRHSGSVNMLVLGACFLVGGIFIGRPYCRYLCPYGAILGLVSRWSKWHVRVPPEQCVQCRLCEDACPYGAIREPTVTLAPIERRTGRRRLIVMLAACPLLIGGGFFFGRQLEVPLAHLHPTVRLADRVRLEQIGRVEGTVDASDAFRNTGRAVADLYREAISISDMFRTAGGWFGAWVGLVVAAKLVHLSIRRRRSDYEPDRTSCVSCGRCFWYCPCDSEVHLSTNLK